MKLPIIGAAVARPRLVMAALAAAVLFILLPGDWRVATKLLSAWDTGLAFYLILVAVMMYGGDHHQIRKRAAWEDEGGLVILGLTVFGALASLAAIMLELAAAKSLSGHAMGQAIGLAAATVFLSWVFMQTMFALHYAHEYYSENAEDGGGLEFPAKYRTPDYWDFIYFSFIIGTAAQTADINITSRVMRRIVTLQCVIIFFFNTTILALAINVGAGLAQ